MKPGCPVFLDQNNKAVSPVSLPARMPGGSDVMEKSRFSRYVLSESGFDIFQDLFRGSIHDAYAGLCQRSIHCLHLPSVAFLLVFYRYPSYLRFSSDCAVAIR